MYIKVLHVRCCILQFKYKYNVMCYCTIAINFHSACVHFTVLICYYTMMSVKVDVHYYVLKVIFFIAIIPIHLKIQSLGYIKFTLIADNVNMSFIVFSMT